MKYSSHSGSITVRVGAMPAVLLAMSATAWGQGWGHREAMRPWLEGRFADAERMFLQIGTALGPVNHSQMLCWKSEFEIERGHYGAAATLLHEAKTAITYDLSQTEILERRLARLHLSVGRFADAEKETLNGRKWDGSDTRKLKLSSAMSLTTLGEVYLARGEFAKASAIMEKAIREAKRTSTIDGAEWVRARNNLALANASLGSAGPARLMAEDTQAAAGREWGATSIPALDTMSTIVAINLLDKRISDARQVLEPLLHFRETLYGPQHAKTAESYMQAALLAAAEHNSATAVQLANQSLAIEKSLSAGGMNGRWARALVIAAPLYLATGDGSTARNCYAQAIPVLESELGPDAPFVKSAHQQFADLSAKLRPAP